MRSKNLGKVSQTDSMRKQSQSLDPATAIFAMDQVCESNVCEIEPFEVSVEASQATHPVEQTVAIVDVSHLHVEEPNPAVDVAFRRFHGLTLLEWCIRRLQESELVDQVLIIGQPDQHPKIMNLGLGNARWITSLENDPMARIESVAERFSANWIVHVHPSCPFLDPTLVDRLIIAAWASPESDYVGYIRGDNQAIDWMKLGLIAEVFSTNAIKKARELNLEAPRGISDLIQSHSDVFHAHWVVLPAQLDRDDLRFSLERSHDWERANIYVEAAGEDISWQRLVEMSLMM